MVTTCKLTVSSVAGDNSSSKSVCSSYKNDYSTESIDDHQIQQEFHHGIIYNIVIKRRYYQYCSTYCQVTHVPYLMFILILCLFNNQIVSVAHSRVTFWLPPRCEPV